MSTTTEPGFMFRPLQSVLDEPRPEALTSPRRMDLVAGAALAIAAGIEFWLRQELNLVGLSVLVVAVPAIIYRRVFPLGSIGAVFLAFAGVDIYQLVTATMVPEMVHSVFFLALAYNLFRWGSGKEMLGGLAFSTAAFALGAISDDLSISELFGGIAIMSVPYVLGMSGRLRARNRGQWILHAKSLERERIARDLHDTVAHHVSAIAIRAQAGLALAARDDGAATEALRVIESEASRTLHEMRIMVGTLRSDALAEYQPHGVEAFESLAGGEDTPPVKLEIRGDVENISEAVGGALFRIAQEAVTNARRHSRDCTRIDVLFEVLEKSVRLEVANDGRSISTSRPHAGYGLIGMAERTELLDGELQAGPRKGGGWRVVAVIRKRGPAS